MEIPGNGRLSRGSPHLVALGIFGALTKLKSAANDLSYTSHVALGLFGQCNAQASKVAHRRSEACMALLFWLNTSFEERTLLNSGHSAEGAYGTINFCSCMWAERMPLMVHIHKTLPSKQLLNAPALTQKSIHPCLDWWLIDAAITLRLSHTSTGLSSPFNHTRSPHDDQTPSVMYISKFFSHINSFSSQICKSSPTQI